MPYYAKKTKKKTTKKNSTSTLVRKLDTIFSKYIRLRDSRMYSFKCCKCISCGRILPYDHFDCGHYYSRMKMSVRFDERNANAECKACNRFSSDHLIGYRDNLIKKIGQREFDLLTIEANQSRKWHAFELEELIKYYTVLVNRYESMK